MQNIFCLCLCLALFFGGMACKKRAPKPEPHASLSPSSINLAGLTFYLTHGELESKLNMLRCSSSDPIVKKCRWSTTKRDRDGVFKGIDEIQFTLYRDSVQTITVYYTQMLDADYKNFDEAVHQKYASLTGDFTLDTVSAEWSYDSLLVKFMPNKKRHWTATMYTYTPVLEFQERMLYKRWIVEVEKQKVNALY